MTRRENWKPYIKAVGDEYWINVPWLKDFQVKDEDFFSMALKDETMIRSFREENVRLHSFNKKDQIIRYSFVVFQ